MTKVPKITSLLFLFNILGDEVRYLHTDKHESLLQIDSMVVFVFLQGFLHF